MDYFFAINCNLVKKEKRKQSRPHYVIKGGCLEAQILTKDASFNSLPVINSSPSLYVFMLSFFYCL